MFSLLSAFLFIKSNQVLFWFSWQFVCVSLVAGNRPLLIGKIHLSPWNSHTSSYSYVDTSFFIFVAFLILSDFYITLVSFLDFLPIGSMYAIYGVPWIPSIYPSHVSIYTIDGSSGVDRFNLITSSCLTFLICYTPVMLAFFYQHQPDPSWVVGCSLYPSSRRDASAGRWRSLWRAAHRNRGLRKPGRLEVVPKPRIIPKGSRKS